MHSITDWEWSSYNAILLDTDTGLKKGMVPEYFETKDEYKGQHNLLIRGKAFLDIEL